MRGGRPTARLSSHREHVSYASFGGICKPVIEEHRLEQMEDRAQGSRPAGAVSRMTTLSVAILSVHGSKVRRHDAPNRAAQLPPHQPQTVRRVRRPARKLQRPLIWDSKHARHVRWRVQMVWFPASKNQTQEQRMKLGVSETEAEGPGPRSGDWTPRVWF